tara:strand:- start:4489 stop:4596 length:108 start_codon:yes stop_codon:yes gene_type:complete
MINNILDESDTTGAGSSTSFTISMGSEVSLVESQL